MAEPDAAPRKGPPGGTSRLLPDAARNLALNRIGLFEWDLESGRMQMDRVALDIFDLQPEEYPGDADALISRLSQEESDRIDAVVDDALAKGREAHGTYFRVRRRDGSLRWAHGQGHFLPHGTGRPRRIVGIVRDATQELTSAVERGAVEVGHRPPGIGIETTAAALSRALTVRDVIEILESIGGGPGAGAERPVTLMLGLVEGGRLHLITRGRIRVETAPEYSALDDENPMCEVVRTGELRLIGSRREFAERYPRLWPYLEPVEFGSAAYLPLVAQSRTLGVIGILFREEVPFTPEDRGSYVGFSTTLAQSLQRAMLFDHEHEVAEGLQQTMLPRIPAVPGAEVAVRYRAARHRRELGGDWYDLIPLPGGKVGAVVGDVTGHDIKAAAVMGQLRIALRAYAAEGHSAATVMARASVFLGELGSDRFATCLYAEADPLAGELRIVRAGHLDPLLRQADGTCRPLPVAGGLPLGLSAEFDALEYPVTPVELGADETLVLYTDGLIEQPGTDLDEGRSELVKALTNGPYDLEELADHLPRALGDRIGDDDTALLLLRRVGHPEPHLRRRLHQHVAPADPESLATARHMLREAVRAWGVTERADDIELVADELITNSLLHTDGGAVVTVLMLPGSERRLRLEVQDRSSGWPRRREPGDASTSGRGLLLVDMLTDVWGVESRGPGKAVWGEFGQAAGR
ncbi:SpoIIE family protein phosphatase [Streptomyces xinghaiensis]|uniref:SpoIIE family protein phosphatase n=1 Tax=Streptomyces xinghaiensis TaxID=1038928 RepID=UPI002E150948|nr:SpoIIE family protein phosphatase [Streptomyces xinghaiensis]